MVGKGDDITEAVYAAGVVGAGGAGFPTHLKLEHRVDLVIANGVECEPLLYHDKHVMEDKAKEVVEGLRLALKATGAGEGIIALKEHNDRCARSLEKVIRKSDRFRLFMMPDYYPAGDEQELVRAVTGKRVGAGKLPLSLNVVVSNVTTLMQISEAVAGKPVIERPISIVGAVTTPCTVTVPLGISFSSVLEQTSNSLPRGHRILMNGIMMGIPSAEEDVITKTTTALLVLPADHPRFREFDIPLERQLRRAATLCRQCQACKDICPRYLLGHPLGPHLSMRSRMIDKTVLKSAILCSECGLCTLTGCSVGLSPRLLHRHLKAELLRSGTAQTETWEMSAEHHLRSQRRISSDRLKEKVRIKEYDREPVRFRGTLRPACLKIYLKQHIGMTANPLVSVGQKIKAGGLIGDVPRSAVGARLHSPVTGEIQRVGPAEIELRPAQ